MGSELILVLVVACGFAFDFTNGFHDTANAVATSIATGALKPYVAVMMSAVLNFAGAFISITVAATIAKGIINPAVLSGANGLVLVLAALLGAMIWNLITWYFTIPSSSSHALIGGVIGATIAAVGSGAVNVHGLFQSVIIPGILSPFICGGVAFVGTVGAYRLIRRIGQEKARAGYRYGQIGSAALVSLAHGTNDAQKTMGVISLALIAHGSISAAHFSVPLWVKFGCATAIALGTATGGWRIIKTMGERITHVESPQGFAAESSTAAVILASSYYGYPLSTTQVVSGGVMGAGLGKAGGVVHWNVAGQMVTAWVFTIPLAATLSAAVWQISDLFSNPNVGSVVIVALTAAVAATLYRLSKRSPVSAADLDRTQVEPALELGGRQSLDVQEMSALATALINWSALWKIVVAAIVGGIGVVLVFGLLLLTLSRAQSADSAARRYAFYALSVVCGALCVAAVAAGIYAMAKKPVSKPATTKTASASTAG